MTEFLTASDVRREIMEEVADWGSQKAVAKRIGVSPAYLSDVLLCRREPGPKIASYFDLEPVTLYRALSNVSRLED
jgi:DNA-binding transcriptional regulator YdaS (Cro superfamily)